MNNKTIKNIKDVLSELPGRNQQSRDLLCDLLDVELSDSNDQQKNEAILKLIDISVKGRDRNDTY